MEPVQQKFVNGMEHRIREAGRSIEELVLEPFAAICRELLEDFPAEYAAKEKFLTGCEDGVIVGGITDDWRIACYKHASHAALHNGLTSRWAGNQVFPNGFIEMDLKRGGELVIFGAPEVSHEFSLICDGRRMNAKFDDNGRFVLALLPPDQNVSVRLEKNGSDYPVFHAIVTREPWSGG